MSDLATGPTRRRGPRRLGAAMLALAGMSLPGPTGTALAQTPNASFTLIGHIEALSLTPPSDAVAAARIKVRGIDVVLPRNLLVTMPGAYFTAQDLFRGPAGGAVQASSGLALADPSPPPVTFEAEVIGNIVGGTYIAGVVRISQGALHAGGGFIQAIDGATGEIRVGAKGGATGARVRLNDPKGRYGVANAAAAKAALPLDIRFALDPDNVPVHAKTGFPVCIPPAGGSVTCPLANRPAGTQRFTCARLSGGQLAPAAAVDAPSRQCDPERPVPLVLGDYVTYVGMLHRDPAGGFVVAAHGLDAELGIYTSPGAEPAYLFVEVAIQGTKGEPFDAVPQEETTRFRVVGFTTDPSRNVEVSLVDSGRDGPGTSFTGPAGLTPSNGPAMGRFRNTWPAKDDARAVRRDVLVRVVGSPNAPLANGLTAGLYTAPVGEYIYPEPTTFGVRGFPLPVPFENFCFLANGGGTFTTLSSGVANIGRLSPYPDSGHTLSQQVGTGTARACDGQ